MTIEQFKKIKTHFNAIIDTINKTKINGRDKYYSKFKQYDHHVKNTIEIPKAKVYNEPIEYNGTQILTSDEFHWESSNTDTTKLNLGIYANFESDEYKVYFQIQELHTSYSPAFEIKPTDKIVFDETYSSNNFVDFIKRFGQIYLSLYDGSNKLFSNVEDTTTIEENITEILRTLEM